MRSSSLVGLFASGAGRFRAAIAATAIAVIAAGTVPAEAQRGGGPQSVAPLAEKLIDAVVNISTSQTVKGPQGVPLPKVPKGVSVRGVLRRLLQQKGQGKPQPDRKVSSLGSGFVVDGKEGLVVTNNHVIEGADEIIVNFHDGSKLKVDKVLGKRYQDRPRTPEGHAEETACRKCISARPPP